ncbi:MAG: NrsF family protein [Burkholderiaceae bacterium]
MKTDDLITALIADRRTAPPPVTTFWRWMVASVAIAAIALLATAGVRADFAVAAVSPRVLFKLLLAAGLIVAAAGAVLRLGRPGARLGGWLTGLLAMPCLLALGVGIELLVLPSDLWIAQARGVNATWCLRMIPLFAAAPLVACLAVLHQAAPTRPVLGGAAAGLLAGAIGAGVYALHCTDDSPLFVATWYSLAVLSVTALGAIAGSRILRW